MDLNIKNIEQNGSEQGPQQYLKGWLEHFMYA